MNIEKKINILFILPSFDTGGSEKLVIDLVAHLDRAKFNLVLCVFFNGTYAKKVKELAIPFYVVHEDGKIKSKIAVIKFLNAIIRKHMIDVVNTHHLSALLQGLLSCKLFNHTKVVHTEHTNLSYHSDVIRPKHLLMLRFFLRFTDMSLGISQGVCTYFNKNLGVPSAKITKITNGVDVGRFRFTTDAKSRLRKEYGSRLGIGDNEIIIGMCANFRKQKNHRNLILATNLLRKQGIFNFRIVFVGDGPEFKNIATMVNELSLADNVMLLGFRLDIPELMAVFDIYCLPSFFEGLPISLIESMAAGLPSVVTDVDGNRDVLVHEKSGLLVSSNDPMGLANALKILIKNDTMRRSMGAFALEHSLKFSFSNMVNEYENLFFNLNKPCASAR